MDFDSTLATTSCKILVNHINGTSSKLTPEEFNTYKSQPFDKFDYSEFNEIIHPEALPLMVLARQLCTEGHPIFVLTARGIDAKNPIVRYLESQGVVLHQIYCVGKYDGKVEVEKEKRKILLTIMEGFDRIYFYDDCESIIDHVSDLPNTKTYHVK
jgi:hypothetical protein